MGSICSLNMERVFEERVLVWGDDFHAQSMDGFRCNGICGDRVIVSSNVRWCLDRSAEQDLCCWLRVVRKVNEPACVQAAEDDFGCDVECPPPVTSLLISLTRLIGK